MKVHVVSTRGDLAALLPEWSRLFERDPRAAARSEPHLIHSFHRMFTPEIRPRVLVVTDAQGEVRGVLPLGLQVRRIGPAFVRHLIPLIDWHAHYTDAVVDPDDSDVVCSCLGRALNALAWDRLDINHVRKESWLLDPEIGILTSLPMVSRLEGLPAPRIVLPTTKALGGNSGKDLRRRLRALEATGKVVIGWEPTGPMLLPAVRAFVRLHFELKTVQRQTRTFSFGTSQRDFPPWLVNEISVGRAGLLTTRRDGVLLAASVILRSHGEAHAYRAARDPATAAFSLGILQTTRAIEACTALGDNIFDLGPGSEPYKAKWRPDVSTLVNLTATRSGWRPTLAAAWMRLRGRPPREWRTTPAGQREVARVN